VKPVAGLITADGDEGVAGASVLVELELTQLATTA